MAIEVKIDKRLFNEKFLPAMDSACRFVLLYGGAGSGKSYVCVQILLCLLMTLPMMNLLVVRKTAVSNRSSTFALFQQIISKMNLSDLFRVNVSNMTITCINGNSVVFKGLDDTEKLKSITFPKGIMTHIWIEEASEIEEADLNQLNVRLRGNEAVKKQIFMTFNPISVTHWLKERFFDRPGMDAFIIHSTYKDNRFIDADYRRELEAFKETDEYYYSVYCLGEWGVIGKTVFNARNVHDQLAKNIKPLKVGMFICDVTESGVVSDIRFLECEDGFVYIYEEPKEGYPYVIGGDTAGEGSDFFAGQVLDNVSGRQVAVLHQETDEDLYALQMYCLGMYYNKALMAVERNFSTHPVKELERLKYPNQYVQVDEDKFTHKPKQIFGFTTTSRSRSEIVAELVRVMREQSELICDRKTLEEMLTFVRNERGKPEAEDGKHDDLIMALAIAGHLRAHQSKEEPHKDAPKVKWEDDMWVDYYNASEDMRKKLIEKWGEPM